MKGLIIGIIMIAAAVVVCIPEGLGWWGEVKTFLKGLAPVLSVIIGFIAILIGIADIKDRIESKKNKTGETQN